jgi:hypothetical protein
MAKRSHTHTDDDAANQAARERQSSLQCARLIRSATSNGEWLRSRGRSRLKWLKIGARQKERNCWASVQNIRRNRNAFKPLPDDSPLCQIVADRAIRPVVATLRVPGRYRKLMLEGKPTAFATPRLAGMMNTKDFVQFAPKQRRYA